LSLVNLPMASNGWDGEEPSRPGRSTAGDRLGRAERVPAPIRPATAAAPRRNLAPTFTLPPLPPAVGTVDEGKYLGLEVRDMARKLLGLAMRRRAAACTRRGRRV